MKTPTRSPARPSKPSARPTHKDIARLAGTSLATVSHVLNNRGAEQRISEKTREGVLEAARRLGYLPDLNARRLRHRLGASASPDLVLAVLRPAGSTLGLAAPIVDAVSASLRTLAGAPQLVLEEFEPGRIAEHPGLLAGSRFHGAIVTGLTPEDETFLEENDLLVPLVAFQRRVVGRAYVDVDNVAGGARATHHLLGLGRRRIAALTYAQPPSRAQQNRVEGYRRAIAALGHPAEVRVVVAASPDPSDGAAATKRLLAEWRPDAIFALIDSLALGALHVLDGAGVRVPHEVAVVGYDDTEYAPVAHPPLSSVRKPDAEMVAAAVEWLAAAARGAAGAPLQRVYDPTLIIRASSAQ
jgi:LacI family transcriptional regulator